LGRAKIAFIWFTIRLCSLIRFYRSRFGHLASSSSIVGIPTMLQWRFSPRSQPRKARMQRRHCPPIAWAIAVVAVSSILAWPGRAFLKSAIHLLAPLDQQIAFCAVTFDDPAARADHARAKGRHRYRAGEGHCA